MAILEGLVIATIILAGAWIGYHAWQDSLHEKAEGHNINIQPSTLNEKIYSGFQYLEHIPKPTLNYK